MNHWVCIVFGICFLTNIPDRSFYGDLTYKWYASSHYKPVSSTCFRDQLNWWCCLPVNVWNLYLPSSHILSNNQIWLWCLPESNILLLGEWLRDLFFWTGTIKHFPVPLFNPPKTRWSSNWDDLNCIFAVKHRFIDLNDFSRSTHFFFFFYSIGSYSNNTSLQKEAQSVHIWWLLTPNCLPIIFSDTLFVDLWFEYLKYFQMRVFKKSVSVTAPKIFQILVNFQLKQILSHSNMTFQFERQTMNELTFDLQLIIYLYSISRKN